VRGTSRAIVNADQFNVMFIGKRRRVLDLGGIRTVPLWMQLPLGIVFAGMTLLFAILAIGLPLESFVAKTGAHDYKGEVMLAFALSLICIFTARVSLRLFKKRENFVPPSSPRTIRIVSCYFLFLALSSTIRLFRGDVTFGNCAILAFLLLDFFILQNIANMRQRQIHNQSTDPTLASGTSGAGHQSRHP
jgi:hypothetical protein